MLPEVLLLCPSIVARRMRDRNQVPIMPGRDTAEGTVRQRAGTTPARKDRLRYFRTLSY